MYEPDEVRLSWLADFFDIQVEHLRRSGQDVHVQNPNGTGYRLGYFMHANEFARENPVMRALWRHGVMCSERGIYTKEHLGPNTEPQYDMFITFDNSGNVESISFNRAGMEAESAPFPLSAVMLTEDMRELWGAREVAEEPPRPRDDVDDMVLTTRGMETIGPQWVAMAKKCGVPCGERTKGGD